MIKYVSVIFLFLGLILLSCKSDSPEDQNKSGTNKPIEKLTDDELLLNSIQNAYNFQKFESEDQVKFKAKLMLSDTIFYEGFIVVKTNSPQIRLLNANIDTVLHAKQLDSNFHKALFWTAECYALPFRLKADSFQKLSKQDSLVESKYTSDLTNTDFTIFTHPLTHIIQKIEYKTNIPINPFNEGSIYYKRYITVNRIPVAMKWHIDVDEKLKANIEISRISYPK